MTNFRFSMLTAMTTAGVVMTSMGSGPMMPPSVGSGSAASREPLMAVEFGSLRCPTCRAFRSIWDSVQKKISIPAKSYYLENTEDYNRMMRDRTGDNGIPALWIYGRDKPVGLVYAYDVDDGEYFPSVDELAAKVCTKVREAGGECTINIDDDDVAADEKEWNPEGVVNVFPTEKTFASQFKVFPKEDEPLEVALEGPDSSIWVLTPVMLICCMVILVILLRRKKSPPCKGNEE